MNRDNHYEQAFEEFLRGRGVAVMPLDDARRSYLDTEEVKSPDFLVFGAAESRLVVDVKGRKFPCGAINKPRKTWDNWVENEDVDGLTRWTERFGPGFRGVFVFVYHILPSVTLPATTPDLFFYRDRLYLARGIDVEDYREHMKPRSARWGVVDLPMEVFRRAVRPFSDFLKMADPRATEESGIEGRRESSSLGFFE